jgi:hypothetical protein
MMFSRCGLIAAADGRATVMPWSPFGSVRSTAPREPREKIFDRLAVRRRPPSPPSAAPPGSVASGPQKAARKRIGRSVLGTRVNVATLGGSPFESDTAAANGSSIALLAELEGRSCLLAGDRFTGVMAQSITRLLKARGQKRLSVGAFKLPHCGRRFNVSRDLLQIISSQRYLVLPE